MIRLKQLYVGAMLFLIVFATGCITTTTNSNNTPSNTHTTPTTTPTTTQWTPQTWTAYDKDLTLNTQYYIGSINIHHTSKVTIYLNILSEANTISYLAIIPASELDKWKADSSDITYEFITHHAKSGTYTATLSQGEYYVLVGFADPIHETLTSGTEVINAGEYTGIPISLSDALYAENVKATIDIREDLDIDLWFLPASEFQIYQEGGTPKVVAHYKTVKSGTYDITNAPPSYLSWIDPDTYYLVLDNTYSIFTKKTVDYTVTADVVYPARIHLKVEIEEED